MPRILVHAALLFCAAGPLAQVAAAENGKAETPSDMICRYEQETGSHIKKRSCATRAVREEQAKRDQKEMQRLTRANPRAPGN